MRESYEVEYALYIYVSMDEYTNYSHEKTHFFSLVQNMQRDTVVSKIHFLKYFAVSKI
jgi:hypothetical protein